MNSVSRASGEVQVRLERNARELVLPLLGSAVTELTGETQQGFGRRGDIDCAVKGLEPLWPLRIPAGWRLCQCLRYDLGGWQWILDISGDSIVIDSLDDPLGLGVYGFPTAVVGEAIDDATLGVYRTAKCVRKAPIWERLYGQSRPLHREWQSIRGLAWKDSQRYERLLDGVFGSSISRQLRGFVLSGVDADEPLLQRARRAQFVRRFRSPERMLKAFGLGCLRWWSRLTAPTGLIVVIAGPDGAGKSTLAAGLIEAGSGFFRRSERVHWRPGVLPRLGSILGAELGDVSDPHQRPPHGAAISAAILAYYWVDFAVGGVVKLLPTKIRSGLVIVERGWTDLEIDHRRYRLSRVSSAVSGLGGLLSRPDMYIVLEARPDVLAGRKMELPPSELARQTDAWRRALASDSRALFLDASRGASEVLTDAREGIVRLLEARAARRLGRGWVNLPKGRTRWWLPRGPRSVAARGLQIHQPMSTRGRAVWWAARTLAQAGGFQLLGRGEAPPHQVREAIAPFVPHGGTMVIARANHPGRYVALLIGKNGETISVAKIATTDSQRRVLAAETDHIRSLGALLEEPVRAPRILGTSNDVLSMEPVEWRLRTRPWHLPEDLAHAMGRFFRAGESKDRTDGPTHGDFAPWNVLWTGDGWMLVDWEAASPFGRPFFDLLHYLVQAHALLGRPSHAELLSGVQGQGSLGRSVRAYAEGAGIPFEAALGALGEYLAISGGALDPSTPDGRRGISARARLMKQWKMTCGF